MQKKFDFTAPSADLAMETAVQKLHIASDKIYVNVLGETAEGVNCEALIDVNLTLEGKKYLEGILKALGIGYQIEARSINGEEYFIAPGVFQRIVSDNRLGSFFSHFILLLTTAYSQRSASTWCWR